jgi:hypothetical protein
MDITDTIDLEEFGKATRPHAPMYIWRGDKSLTEVSIVSNWLVARFENWPQHFPKFEHLNPPDDPPDVILTDIEGRKHGVELTELVHDATIRTRCAGNQTDCHVCTESELKMEIANIIARKSKKPFKGGPFESRILLIHTAEPFIAYGSGPEYFSRMSGFAYSYFDEVWVMIPPAPDISGAGPGDMRDRVFEIKK